MVIFNPLYQAKKIEEGGDDNMGLKRTRKRKANLPHTKINGLAGFEELLQRMDRLIFEFDKRKSRRDK